MRFVECIPDVHGPKTELGYVYDVVASWAKGVNTDISQAKLVGSRFTRMHYISHKKFEHATENVCLNSGSHYLINPLLSEYDNLDRDAHLYKLCAINLCTLTRLPKYRSFATVLAQILNISAADWDIVISGCHHTDQIEIPRTRSIVELHSDK